MKKLIIVVVVVALFALASAQPAIAKPQRPKGPKVTFDVALQAGTVLVPVLTNTANNGGFCGTGELSSSGVLQGRFNQDTFDCLLPYVLGTALPECPTLTKEGLTLCFLVYGLDIDDATGLIVAFRFGFAEVLEDGRKDIQVRWHSGTMELSTPVNPDPAGFEIALNKKVTLFLADDLDAKGKREGLSRPDFVDVEMGVIAFRPA